LKSILPESKGRDNTFRSTEDFPYVQMKSI
jgi:hypothetical protein